MATFLLFILLCPLSVKEFVKEDTVQTAVSLIGRQRSTTQFLKKDGHPSLPHLPFAFSFSMGTDPPHNLFLKSEVRTSILSVGYFLTGQNILAFWSVFYTVVLVEKYIRWNKGKFQPSIQQRRTRYWYHSRRCTDCPPCYCWRDVHAVWTVILCAKCSSILVLPQIVRDHPQPPTRNVVGGYLSKRKLL